MWISAVVFLGNGTVYVSKMFVVCLNEMPCQGLAVYEVQVQFSKLQSDKVSTVVYTSYQ